MCDHDEATRFAEAFLSEDILHQEVINSPPTEAELLNLEDALKRAALAPDTNDFDVLVHRAADLLRKNETLPDWLALFAADVLEGKRKRPIKRGPDKYQNWERDYSWWRAVDEVASKFDLAKYTNNELSNKPTAAEIVAEAARVKVDVVIRAYKNFSKGEK